MAHMAILVMHKWIILDELFFFEQTYFLHRHKKDLISFRNEILLFLLIWQFLNQITSNTYLYASISLTVRISAI